MGFGAVFTLGLEFFSTDHREFSNQGCSFRRKSSATALVCFLDLAGLAAREVPTVCALFHVDCIHVAPTSLLLSLEVRAVHHAFALIFEVLTSISFL